MTATLGVFRLTAVRQGTATIVSMATVESVTSDNNGATITCNDDIVSNAGSLAAVVRVTGKSVLQVIINVGSACLQVISHFSCRSARNFKQCASDTLVTHINESYLGPSTELHSLCSKLCCSVHSWNRFN